MQAKRSWVAMAAGLVGLAITLAIAPAPATAEPVLDANCPGPPTGLVVVGSNARRAQTFTAQTTGTLVRGEFEIDKEAMTTADWVMQIVTTDASGVPTNTVLASTAIPDAAVPVGNSRLVGTFAAPADVQAGQRYAIVVTRPALGFLAGERGGDPCPGNEFFSVSQAGAWIQDLASLDHVFAVFVEPLPAEPEHLDTAPPLATITKGPKDKTKKKTATFEFTGTDARAIAGFQCKLDSGAFAPCTSPHTVRVKKGKHTFQVQAIDQAGNVGTPATDDWKVKRKRKK
jgi:hypothetical protein